LTPESRPPPPVDRGGGAGPECGCISSAPASCKIGSIQSLTGVGPWLEQRLIKKYPNRRLYDTEESRYITLVDVQRLVREGMDIKVVTDTQSGEDITRGILIQIITEQEAGGNPLFTTDMLTRFIRFYDESLQDAFSSFLDQTLKLYADQQQQMQAQIEQLMPGRRGHLDPLTERNMELWREMQDSFFRAAGLPGIGRSGGPSRRSSHQSAPASASAVPAGIPRQGHPRKPHP
jgi:polyhydroxyalkanoate synthesis repressor PhaR